MEIGIVGLGRMGANIARRLMQAGHRVVAYNRTYAKTEALAAEGAVPAASLADLCANLSAPRAVWVMLTAGEPTESMLAHLAEVLEPGDTVLEGGNSYYRDSMRRAAELASRGLHFLDVGTSGGVWGLAGGYSLMIGGESAAVERLRPIFEALAPAPDRGWGRVGPAGAGHFVKMVHNGIEYGLMQAYAEGFDLLRRKEEFGLDLRQVAAVWQSGSVVRSWLLELVGRALQQDPALAAVAPVVADSGEGRWTAREGIELGCPLPVITLALQRRFESQSTEHFADRLLAMLRHEFGGHEVQANPPEGDAGG